MAKLKICFIGYGAFSKVRERFLNQRNDVEIIGFFDPFVDEAKHIAKFESPEAMLESANAVIISVPPKLAPKYVALALKSNVKVFCEKPAAVNVEDLSKVKAHLTSKSLLAYGFNHRLHPSIQKMKRLVESKSFGKILWMRGRYGKEVDENYRDSWRCDKYLNGGGILIDQGIHLVDLMSYLSGGFDGCKSVLSSNYLGIDKVDDNGFITLYSSKSKISASIHSTITQWRYLFSLEIFLERGSATLNGLRTNSGNYGEEILTIKPNFLNEPEIGTAEFRYPENISWKKEMNAFVDACVSNNAYPYAGYHDAVETTSLIDLIYKEATWL